MDAPIKRYKCKDQIKERIELDKEFKDMFMELSLNYLLDHPTDFISYSTNFFEKLKASRKTLLVYDLPASEESTLFAEDEYDDDIPQLEFRRPCIVGECYNPEKATFQGVLAYPKNDQQQYYLQKAVTDVFLFRILDPKTREDLISAMYEVSVVAGEEIIKMGEEVDKFYVVGSGTYYVLSSEMKPNVNRIYQNSGNFAQIALLHSVPWDSTIRAETDGTLWALNRITYRHLTVNAKYRRRKLGEQLINSVPLMKNLAPESLSALSDALVLSVYPPGQRIVKQSGPSDGVYFVLRGNIVLTFVNDCGAEIVIRTVGPNMHFGEMCLISDKPRFFSAYASEKDEVETLFLSVVAFERILGPTIDVLRENICLYQQQKRKFPVIQQESCFGE